MYNAITEFKTQMTKTNDTYESLINTIQNRITCKGGNSGISNQFLESFKDLQNFFETLNFIDTLAILHLSGVLFIFAASWTIMLTLFGEKLITYFNIENKYPKLAKFIQVRRKLQNYSIAFNIFLIFIVLFSILIINILILFILI